MSPSPSPRLLVYGATGYTGKLVAAEAAARGIDVVLGGRDAQKLEAVAGPLGFETRSVALHEGPRLQAALEDVAAVLHIAGPFSATAAPMVDACLATGTHYLDVTGEIDVFETLARRGDEAAEAGVALVPGVGFDVVPTDCLAAHTASRVDDPQRVFLAIAGLGSGVSRGTAKTSVESVGRGLAIRRDGVIAYRPMGSLERDFDFGAGPVRAIGMPLGDVATAFHSTGAPDVETYVVTSGSLPRALRLSRLAAPLLRRKGVQSFLKHRIDASAPEGPTDEERLGQRTLILAEVEGAEGQRARGLLETPSPYALTAIAALEALQRIARGVAPPGYHTPATALGADFATELDGCIRRELPVG